MEPPLLRRKIAGGVIATHTLVARDKSVVDCQLLADVKPPPLELGELARIRCFDLTEAWVQRSALTPVLERELPVVVTAEGLLLFTYSVNRSGIPLAKITDPTDILLEAGKSLFAKIGLIAKESPVNMT